MATEERYICDRCGRVSDPSDTRDEVWTEVRGDNLYPRAVRLGMSYQVWGGERHLCPGCTNDLLAAFPCLAGQR